MEYLKLGKSIVIADLHIGIELEYASKGIYIPWQTDSLKEKIEKIRDIEKNAKRLIIDGDLKHTILKIDQREIKHVLDFINFAEEIFDEVLIIKGNHDGKIQKILIGRPVIPYFVEKEALVIHGHKMIPKEVDVNRIIIGHVHPIFKVNMKSIKVYVRGFLEKKEVIILPAFGDLCGGRDPREGIKKGPIARRIKNIEVISLEGDLLMKI